MPDSRTSESGARDGDHRPTGPDPQGPSRQAPPPSGAPPGGPLPTGHPSDSVGAGGASDDDEVVNGELVEEGEAGDVESVVDAEIVDESPESAAEAVEVDMLAAIGQVEKQRDDYLEALQRLQADFENYKKRMMRQQSEILERSGFDLVEKLLPVLDAIDLAKQHGAGGDPKALEQIASQLLDVLGKEGLERVDPVGEAFDPNEHEAVAHEPGGDSEPDAEPSGPTVSGLMRAGWRWRGRLVRAAMVTVKG